MYLEVIWCPTMKKLFSHSTLYLVGFQLSNHMISYLFFSDIHPLSYNVYISIRYFITYPHMNEIFSLPCLAPFFHLVIFILSELVPSFAMVFQLLHLNLDQGVSFILSHSMLDHFKSWKNFTFLFLVFVVVFRND